MTKELLTYSEEYNFHGEIQDVVFTDPYLYKDVLSFLEEFTNKFEDKLEQISNRFIDDLIELSTAYHHYAAKQRILGNLEVPLEKLDAVTDIRFEVPGHAPTSILELIRNVNKRLANNVYQMTKVEVFSEDYMVYNALNDLMIYEDVFQNLVQNELEELKRPEDQFASMEFDEHEYFSKLSSKEQEIFLTGSSYRYVKELMGLSLKEFDDRLGLDYLFVASGYHFHDGRVFIDTTSEYFHKQ